MSEPASVSPQTIEVAGGETLVLRAGTAGDAPALRRLYQELEPEDRRARFFTAGVPRRVADEWSAIGDHGGLLLVAELVDAGRVVGEAGYAPLPNGDAEFGITVAKRWRGWLGPFLLDALLHEAGRRGIPNLEGSILVTNRPMLALARRRGCVLLARPDVGVLRLLISTAGRTPSWPPITDRRRVLVESSSLTSAVAEELRADGFEVVTCAGPPHDHPEACPFVAGARCPLVDGADVVVLARAPAADVADPVVSAYERRPDAPACVRATEAGDVIAAVKAMRH